MRGEFIGVWSETYREIWLPLVDHEAVPSDVFCDLYRELDSALRVGVSDNPRALALNDAIQLRELFELAVLRADGTFELDHVLQAFADSGVAGIDDASQRHAALEAALSSLIGDTAQASALLGQALDDITGNAKKRAEAKERALDRIVNDRAESRNAFERVQASDLSGERSLVAFFEAAYAVLDELGADDLSNRYFNLLEAFVEKFSLRYDLRRPCTLCPTLPGMFASLVRDLRDVASHDIHLDALMKDFENSIRDLRMDCSDGRIKTCIQKQVNLLEAIGRTCPGVTGTTLGAISSQVSTWPHEKLREAMKNLYGFASDYPGIRHGGTPTNAMRVIEMRDLVAMSILLAGFTPYLSDQLNADLVYRGL